MGIVFATFSCALSATAWVDREATGHVAIVSWAICIVLLGASIIVFARLVRRLADLQIGNTLRFIGDQGRAVIAESFARAHGAPPRSSGRSAGCSG